MKNSYMNYLNRRKAEREYIIKMWTVQLCLDTIAEILNDPKVMAKDVFGKKRLEKLCAEFNARFPERMSALTKNPESDYMRAKIDERQKQIFGPDCMEWAERYESWNKVGEK